MNNNVDKIIKWVREVDRNYLPNGVVNLGWGPKVKNGIETGEYCVIFTVLEKKPIDKLTIEEIIPDELQLDIDDTIITFATDVVEPIEYKRLIQYCNLQSNTVDPVRQNRIRRRPIMGGIETMTDWGNYVGTLGLLVKDKTDGQIVALSNNHVYAASQVGVFFNRVNDMGYTNNLTVSGFQPTGFWKTTRENDCIGRAKRAVLIGDKVNYSPGLIGAYIDETSCDAAIVELSGYSLIDSLSSPNVLNFRELAPYKFANDLEIDSLAPGGSNSGAPIFRSGRTLGPIGFPGNTLACGLSVSQLGWEVVGSYSGLASYFSNCFRVRGNVAPGAGGDSGSAMFALFNRNNPSLSAWKCIGLLFAGPEDNSFTIGCRISVIERELNIAPWDTKIPTLTSKKTIIRTEPYILDEYGNFYSDFLTTLTLSGRKFFQIGYEQV
jgi:hypothetical protein